MKKVTRRVIFGLCFTLIRSAASGSSDPGFEEANRAFAAGEFQKAISGYDQLVASRKWSASLFYNLGNAWYRAGDSGRAILNYDRALALEPHHPEAEANVRLVRDQSGALEMLPDHWQRYLLFATTTQFAIVAAITFWLFLFATASTFFADRRSAKRLALLVITFAVSLLSAYAAYMKETGPKGRGLAVIVTKNIEARVATADNAGSVLALPSGSEVTLLSARGDWLYVALPNDRRGWIAANAAESVRL